MKKSVSYLSAVLLVGGLFCSSAFGEQASGRFNVPAKKLYGMVVKMLQQKSASDEKFFKIPGKVISSEEYLSLEYEERCDDIERNPGKCVIYLVTIIPDSASTSTVQVEADNEPVRFPPHSNAEMLLGSIRSEVLNLKEKHSPAHN